MNIGDFLHSRKWRTIQNYTYSFGASVVLIGALAKLEHWAAASGFLMTGLGMEALIFFISAFEPLLENPDWKRVYPQLREGDELPEVLKKYEQIDTEYHQSKKFQGSGEGGGGISIKELPPEVVKKLNDSFEKLALAANEIKEISGASTATNGYISKLQAASQSFGNILESNTRVSDKMTEYGNVISESCNEAAKNILACSNNVASGVNKTVTELSEAIKSTGDNIKASGMKVNQGVSETINDLSASIKNQTESLKTASLKFSDDMEKSSAEYKEKLFKSAKELTEHYNKINESSSGYSGGIEKLNKNIAALNTAYELHLKGAGKVEEVVRQYSNNVAEIGKLLQSSVEETKKFNDNTKEINENIQALNKVYGRMLGALNAKK